MTDIKKEVEAVLFASGRTVTVKELQPLLNVKDTGLVVEAMKELSAEYESRDSPVMLVEEEDGFKLTVRERYLPVVHTVNPHTELSKTILETLAVIAWKQPMLQSNVVKIRTNKAYDHISELERLGFITRVRHGRSYLIKVTQKFLDYFDLPEPKAIKEMFRDFKDIEVAVRKKAKEIGAEGVKDMAVDKGKEKDDGRTAAGKPVTYGDDEAELDTYADSLPPMDHPKKKSELETYTEPAPGVIDETPEEEALEEEKLEEAEHAFEQEEEKEEADEVSDAEKAKRLAEQLLEEDAPEKQEETEHEAERVLHPELEDFISSEHEKGKEEQEGTAGESTSEEKSGDETEDETGEESPVDKAEDPAIKADDKPEGGADEAGEEDSGSEDEPKPAEEYPGQFAKGG
jgi:segregation and condensation protein B